MAIFGNGPALWLNSSALWLSVCALTGSGCSDSFSESQERYVSATATFQDELGVEVTITIPPDEIPKIVSAIIPAVPSPPRSHTDPLGRIVLVNNQNEQALVKFYDDGMNPLFFTNGGKLMVRDGAYDRVDLASGELQTTASNEGLDLRAHLAAVTRATKDPSRVVQREVAGSSL